jgi:hypothetical protein
MNTEAQFHTLALDGRLDFTDALARLERIVTRPCAKCGESFEARGLVAFCAVCGMLPADSENTVRPLGESWPRKQIAKLANMVGRGAAMAFELAPKMVGSRLCILAGNRGLGKTQIATYVAHWRGQNGYSPGFYSLAFDMANRVIGFDRDEKLKDYHRPAFLVLDECHRLDSKDLPLLESVVDYRYRNEKPTMLIGNWITLQGIHKGEEVDGEKLTGVGSSLFSRIQEHQRDKTGGVVWCKWDSYRQQPN